MSSAHDVADTPTQDMDPKNGAVLETAQSEGESPAPKVEQNQATEEEAHAAGTRRRLAARKERGRKRKIASQQKSKCSWCGHPFFDSVSGILLEWDEAKCTLPAQWTGPCDDCNCGACGSRKIEHCC